MNGFGFKNQKTPNQLQFLFLLENNSIRFLILKFNGIAQLPTIYLKAVNYQLNVN